MICAQCQGSGICPTCRGLGQVWCSSCRGRGRVDTAEGARRCDACDGSGVRACAPRCATCEGRGEVLATLEQAVSAPADDGDDFPPGTAVLLIATFLSFAVEGLVPAYRYGFWLYGPQAVGGQWWQFVTSLFLHTNLVQLGFNMAALYVFGPPLEEAIGTRRFVALYLLSGLVGNLLSVWVNPRIQTVGASGCLFGVGGAWIGLQLRRPLFSPSVVGMLLAYIVLMLATGFLTDAGINNQAHLGGFVCGLATGLLLVGSVRSTRGS